jgi:hypothetical protein
MMKQRRRFPELSLGQTVKGIFFFFKKNKKGQ